MQSLVDEKAALVSAKRQLLLISRGFTWSDSRKTSGRNSRHVWTLQKWIEADQGLESAYATQTQAKQEVVALVAEQEQRKMPKQLIKNSQEPNHPRRVPYQTGRHSKPSSLCSSLFLRCKAKVATACRNSSWRLEPRMRRPRKSARLWHTQCVIREQSTRLPSLAQKLAGSLAKKCEQMTSSLLGIAYLVSTA